MDQSAWDTEKLWRRMYLTEENTLGGALFAAMSAIDTALWDIVGKKDYNDLGRKTTLSEWSAPGTPGLGIDFSLQFVKERTVRT